MAPLRTKEEVDSALCRGFRLGFVLDLPPKCNTSAPLVLLLGWWGATNLALRKYSSLLNSWGYPTVRAVCPRWQVVAPVDSPRRHFAGQLLTFLDAVGWQDNNRPVIVWAFGNGGALPTEKMDWLVHTREEHKHLRDRFAAVIFDSAPAYLYSQRMRTAASYQPLRLRLLTWLASGFTTLLHWLLRRKSAAEMYWDDMHTLRLGKRTLYLFSEDDPLCDAAKLHELIEARRAAGFDVTARSWPHGKHVHLLEDHTQEYVAELRTFLGSFSGSAGGSGNGTSASQSTQVAAATGRQGKGQNVRTHEE